MPDEISQAAPTEEIAPEAEVQETAPAEGSAPAEPQTEKPLTPEDFRQMAREEALKVAQSQVAKSENRTNQRIQERFAALEENKGVLKLTEEQVMEAQEQIIREEQRSAFAPKGQTANSPGGQTSSDDQIRQQVEFVYGQINDVFAEVGTEVTPNDPEFKGIDEALKNPKGSLAGTIRAANKAAEAKAARLKVQKESAKARVTGGGSTTGNAKPAASAHDAWGDAYKK